MLSEKEIEALNNGAMGVTAHGLKVKVIEQIEDVHLVALLRGDGWEVISYAAFPQYHISESGGLDIVGLWKDKPEPFDLERALSGEPVKTRDGCKAYVQIKIEQPNELTNYTIIGYGFNGNHREFLHWSENGMVLSDDISCDDIIGMWKEPEPISREMLYLSLLKILGI